MSSPTRLRNHRLLVLPAWIALIFQGCVSYQETGVLHPDGSGEIRIVIGVERSRAEPGKVGEIRRSLQKLPGLRWISAVDSNAGKRRWLGGVVAFDSVAALRPLNSLLPLELLFGKLRLADTDSGRVLTRLVKLPEGSAEDGDFTRIVWTFPGRILQTDKHANVDSADKRVEWNLPTGTSSRVWAATSVRWEEPRYPVLARLDQMPWAKSAPGFPPWPVLFQVLNLVLLAWAAWSVHRATRWLRSPDRAESSSAKKPSRR